MLVQDASRDERFAASPLVTGGYHIRFYAGITLRDGDGFALGTLAVADTMPRGITEQQKDSLERLAGIALDRMELRKTQMSSARLLPLPKRRASTRCPTAPSSAR